HGANRAALLARGGDELLELGRLLLGDLALVAGQILERIKHGRLSTLDRLGPWQNVWMLFAGHDLRSDRTISIKHIGREGQLVQSLRTPPSRAVAEISIFGPHDRGNLLTDNGQTI